MRYVHIDSEHWPAAISDGLTLACGICDVVPKFDYIVENKIWKQVVPKELQLGVICLSCLDELAIKMGINIGMFLLEVQWTGVGKTVVLIPTEVYEYQKN